jgi:hypothetical protein
LVTRFRNSGFTQILRALFPVVVFCHLSDERQRYSRNYGSDYSTAYGYRQPEAV